MPVRRRIALLACCFLPLAPLAGQVATVEVTPPQAVVQAGGTLQFRAVAKNAAGAPVAARIKWLATPFDVAAADTTGLVTTTRPGRTYVIALADGKPGMAVLEITERAPARLSVAAQGDAATVVGGTVQLTASAVTAVGDPVPADVRWTTSAPAVATVDAGGLVRGRSAGTATIQAASGALVARLDIAVRANPVRGLTVRAPTTPLRTGDVVMLRADLMDANGRPVSGAPVRWSTSAHGATVDPDGGFVAERPGSHAVTATVGDRSAVGVVQVLPRNDPRSVVKIAHVAIPGGREAAELWPLGDVVYVSTIASHVYVFDVSDPAAPRLTDSLVVDARLVNDVSVTADGRIGVLSREGASDRKNGLVFFDASDPRHPKVLSQFTEGLTGGVHSAFVYEHYVFATDDATGSLRIIDFADPQRPRQVGRWEVDRRTTGPYAVDWLNVIPERYVHDVHVKDGLAYVAAWRDGLVILDVGRGLKGGSMTSPKLVSQFTYNHAALYPPGFIAGTHTVFAAGRYVFLGDESYSGTMDLESRERFTTRGLLHVIDVSDVARPRKVAEWDPVEFGVHNLWAEGDLLYVGAYDGGLRILDVSGELRGDLGRQGRGIGTLYTGSLTGFRPNMALTWGAIPHRGHVLATDINSGLWVAKVVGTPTP
jgi:hypothetical protein